MKRHTAEQIIPKLRQAETDLAQGSTIAQVCQRLAITEQTFHRWRNQYGGLKADEAKRLKELEAENARLKRLVAELALDKQMLQEVAQKNVVTAAQKRQAVRHFQETFGVSQRRACRLLGQPRATQRQTLKPSEEEERLVRRMLELVRQHPRWGYRRIGVLLRREGWRVKRKRVYRLWRQQGLKVPRNQRKKRRLGHSGNSCLRRPTEHKDHVWSWDFLHDRTSDGRPLKWFTLVDEYTRECLALEVERRMTAQTVRAVLTAVVETRGVPAHIRSDNGSEFIAKAIRSWMTRAGLETWYIAPGAPWENGYAESFNSKVRDELLNVEASGSVLEAKVLAREWRPDYNHVRPHSSLGYRTPTEFGEKCPRPESAALRRAEDTSVTVDPTLTAPGT